MFLAKKKKNYFALAFSDQEIQLVQTNQKGEAVLTATLALEPGIIERGRVRKPDELSSLLKNFLTSQKLKSKFVVAGLSEAAAFCRVLSLPSLPLDELDQAVRWQSEPLLPMPLEEAYLDWMLLEKDEGAVRALVMALPIELVEDYARILEGLGLQPVAFEPTALSLSRLIGKGEKSSLVIKLKEKGAVLVVVGPHGEIELSSTISSKEKGEGDELFSTIEELLTFYEKKVGEKGKVEKIFLCGQMANETVAAKIKKRTSLETEVVPIKPIELASTVSLANKDIAAPIDERTINLIPPRIQGVYDLAEKRRTLTSWIKFWLFSLFLILFAFGVSSARIYFDLKKTEGETIEIQASITPEMREVETKAKTVAKKATQVLALADSQKELVGLLDDIQAAVAQTEGISLNHYSIHFELGQILINGVAASRDQLLSLRENLEKSENISQVKIPLSSLEKEENVNFTISLFGKEKS